MAHVDDRPPDTDEVPRRGRLPRPARPAWLVMALAVGLLAPGLLLAEGLLIAAGLVVGGVAGHLFGPP